MPRAGAEPLDYPASKPVFPELVKELADDARLWLDAELALAKAEAGLRLRGYAAGVIVAVLGVSLFIAATVVLAQAIVSVLMPYVSSQAVAGLCSGRHSACRCHGSWTHRATFAPSQNSILRPDFSVAHGWRA